MIQQITNFRAALAMMMSATLSLLSLMAYAQDARPSSSRPALSTGFRFAEMTGEELYANVCQGCHMSDAKGAAGAGTYPSLAGDSNLEVGFYPVSVVINGQRGMPRLGAMLSDDQLRAASGFGMAVVTTFRTCTEFTYKRFQCCK